MPYTQQVTQVRNLKITHLRNLLIIKWVRRVCNEYFLEMDIINLKIDMNEKTKSFYEIFGNAKLINSREILLSLGR